MYVYVSIFQRIFSNLGVDSNFACFTLFLISASLIFLLVPREFSGLSVLSNIEQWSPCYISCESNLPVQAKLPAGVQLMLAIGTCWYFNGLGLLINQFNSSRPYAKGTQCKLCINSVHKILIKRNVFVNKETKIKINSTKRKRCRERVTLVKMTDGINSMSVCLHSDGTCLFWERHE